MKTYLKLTKIIFTCLVLLISNAIYAQSPQPPNWNDLTKTSKAEWEINDGQFVNGDINNELHDWGEQVIQVSDGGYVVAGFSHSGPDNGPNRQDVGGYITKFNANGNKVWCYTVVNNGGGAFIDVAETDDYFVAVGYDFILRIDKDGSNPKELRASPSFKAGFDCVKKAPLNSVIVTGNFQYADNTNSSIVRKGLVVFCLPLSNIVNTSTFNLAPGNSQIKWMSVIGRNYSSNNSNLPANGHLVSDPHPLFPYEPATVPTATSDYTDFAGVWCHVEPTGGNNYNIYVTGKAQWAKLERSNDLPNVPTKTGTTTILKEEMVTYPSDVLVAKIVAPSGNTSVNVLTDWTKTYNDVPEVASTNPTDPYMQYWANQSPRRPSNITTGTPTTLQKYEGYFFNTLQNSGVYVDECNDNATKLMIGAEYNWHGLPYGHSAIITYGHDYRDADAAAFVINKADGSLLSAKPKLLAHHSGDDLKIRMAQNSIGEFFMVGTTADVVPPREYQYVNGDPTEPIVEAYLTGKFKLDDIQNEASIHWMRDYFDVGTLDYGSNTLEHPHGICGFGIGTTIDNGFVMCGNNNQQIDNSQGRADDLTIVKMSPDGEINANYSATYEPFQSPKVFSGGVTTINSDKVIGRHLIVAPGSELIIENCTLQFANSQWIYDYKALFFNAPTTDPRVGGMVGITVQAGGKLTLSNCTLTGMKALFPNGVGNMWDGVVVEGNPEIGQYPTTQGLLVMDNSTIEDAYVGVTLDGRGYSLQASPNLYSYKTGFCPLYSSLSDPQLGRAFLKRPLNQSYHGKGGGRVIANNSHFFNNSSKHVEYMWYDEYPNWSVFNNTEFTTNSHAPELTRIDDDGDWRGTNAFVTIWANHGIRFRGCNFNGYTVGHVDPANPNPTPIIYKNGAGLVSLNSEFTVSGYCNDGPNSTYPCSDYIPSYFGNLRMGISAAPSLGLPATKYLNISNTLFGMAADGSADGTPNLENIFVNGGGRNVQIHSNKINVADVEETDPSQWGNPQFYPYGIHLQGTDGFLLEENLIVGGDGANILHRNDYGIVINDAGENNNRVYKNEVANLEHALVSLHKNWNDNPNIFDPSTFTGLDWMCNNLSSLSYNGIEVMSGSDIISYNTEYSNNQPNYVTLPNSNHAFYQGANDYPTNNSFDYSCGSGIKLESDPATLGYTYFFDGNQSVMDPGTCNASNVTTVNLSANLNTCESHFNDGTVHHEDKDLDYATLVQGIQAQELLITNLLDDASSASLMVYINDPSISANMLDQYLSIAGPYLDEDVLQAVIERPNAPLSNAQLSQIVLDNSPLSDDTYDELEDERPIISGNYTVVVAQYEELSPRQQLQISLRNFRANKRSLCLTAAHRYMHLATPNPTQAANLFLASGLPLDAVPFMIQAGNYSGANTLLTNFTAVGDDQADEKAYLQMCVNKSLADGSTQEMVSANLSALQTIAAHHTSTAYTAQNLLAQYNDAAMPHAIKPLLGEVGSNKTEKKKREYVITNYLNFFEKNTATLFPNPARDNVVLKTHLVDDAQEVNVEIFTLVGQRVKSVQTKASSGKSNIKLGTLPIGTYLVKVMVDGELILNTKLAVIQ